MGVSASAVSLEGIYLSSTLPPRNEEEQLHITSTLLMMPDSDGEVQTAARMFGE